MSNNNKIIIHSAELPVISVKDVKITEITTEDGIEVSAQSVFVDGRWDDDEKAFIWDLKENEVPVLRSRPTYSCKEDLKVKFSSWLEGE